MSTFWACTCGATGIDTSEAKTDPPHADAKHSATCVGVALTTTTADAAVRLAGRVGAR